jgi:putative transposase
MDDSNKWQKETPFDTRSGAIRKHMAAWSSFFQRRKADPKTNPPNFLRKKSRSDAIFTFDKSAVSFNDGKLRLFPTRLGSLPLRSKDRKRVAKHFQTGEACDGEVVRTKNGRWYIVLPRKMAVEKNRPEGGIVALDPGGRTFNTFYSPDGICGKIGDELYEEPTIQKALQKADKLMSLSAKLDVRCRTRRNVLNRAQALRTKVRDIVRDVHRKTWAFLCNNFSRIFIPPFTAPQMTAVGRRVLNNKAVRNLTTFAHSEFRNGLIDYAAKRGIDVHVGSEAWTTKTCTGCGNTMDVGSRKVVDCSACGLRMDRDVSGSRNNFLRNAVALGLE